MDFIQSGVTGIDEVLGGGFPPNRLYLIEGESGSGKTTLGLQFLLEGAKNNEKVLYIGTSETEEDIRAVAASHGWPLGGVTLFHHKGERNESELGQTVIHPAEIDLPQTMETILAVVEKEKPQRLVIDSLTEIRLLAREAHWYWKQLLMLKTFFINRNCTVLLTEIPSGDHSSAIHSIIHGKVVLEYRAPSYGPDRRRLRINKIQGMQYSSGYHDYKIQQGGLRCFPRLVAAAHRHTFRTRQVSTGKKDLDTLLGGGLDVGTSILLSGPSGTGKSLFATQCCYEAARRGERASMYIFDERIQTLLHRSEAVGLDIRRFIEKDLINIQQIDPAELTPGEFSYHVKQEIDDGSSMVVIDSLNGYAYAMPEERLLTLYLHELSSYLNQKEITSIFVMASRSFNFGETGASMDISYLSDTVIKHRFLMTGSEQVKAISVYKRRSGPHEKTLREMIISENGVSLGGPLSDAEAGGGRGLL